MYCFTLSLCFIFLQLVPEIVGSSSKDLMKDPYWRSIIVNPFKNYTYQTDNLHQQSNIRQYFSSDDLQVMNQMVTTFLTYPNENMWKTVEEVSESHPFILFHQRKAGGSSLRDTLHYASRLTNLTAFIPCNTADCDIYTFPRDKHSAIYAGHFKWGAQSDLAKFNKTLRTQYSCATNYRHPIARIESCIYFRFDDVLRGRCVSELSMSEFQQLFHKTDEFGHSCINEPFRALSGIADEVMLDHLMVGVDDGVMRHRHRSLREVGHESDSWTNRDSLHVTDNSKRHLLEALALDAFNLTLQHTIRCPPIILEFPETYDLATERVPTLGRADAFVSDLVLQAGGKARKKCGHLSGEHLQYVEKHSALEIMLYDAVVRKVTTQIATRYTDYLFHLQCTLRSPRDYLTLEESRGPPIAIVAVDGATIRTLLEYASGVYTGSVRTRREYTTIFPGENFCGKRMIGIYAEIGSFFVTPTNDTDSSALLKYFYSTSVRKCRRGMIPHFSEAVIQIKDPFFEMWKFLRNAHSNHNISAILSEWSMRSLREEEEGLFGVGGSGSSSNGNGNGGNTSSNKIENHTFLQRERERRRELQSSMRDESILKSSMKQLLKSSTKDSKFKQKQKQGNDRDEEEVLQEAEERMHENEKNSQSSAILSTILKNANVSTSSSSHTSMSGTHSKTPAQLEKEKDYEFYRDYMSLIMDFHTYSWIFHHHFVAYYNYTTTPGNPTLSRDNMPKFFRTSPTVPSYPKEYFLFYSIEAVGEGAYQISNHAREHSQYDEVSGNYTTLRRYHDEYDSENNAFLKFLQYTRYENKLKDDNVQCAYSHVRTPNQVGVEKLREYKEMRRYYSEHPLVLERVKEIVKQWMHVINLDPNQMLLMYKL